jgi:hypothetical protein
LVKYIGKNHNAVAILLQYSFQEELEPSEMMLLLSKLDLRNQNIDRVAQVLEKVLNDLVHDPSFGIIV